MTAGGTVEAVALDYGGVLTTSVADALADWCTELGIVRQTFADCLREWRGALASPVSPIRDLETGRLTVADFERRFAARLRRADGSSPEAAGLVRSMLAGLRPDEAMWDLTDELRERGARVAIVSNSWANNYPARMHDGRFDPVLISGDLGMRKPDAPIYRLLCERLELPPERVAFVDDTLANVVGAKRLGLHSIHHRDAATTRAAILAVLAPPPTCAPSPNGEACTDSLAPPEAWTSALPYGPARTAAPSAISIDVPVRDGRRAASPW